MRLGRVPIWNLILRRTQARIQRGAGVGKDPFEAREVLVCGCKLFIKLGLSVFVRVGEWRIVRARLYP